MELLSSLGILFFLIALGSLSRFFNIFQKEQLKTLTAFIYYFGLPALFIVRIAKLNIQEIQTTLLIGSIAPIIIIAIIISLAVTLKLTNKDHAILLGLSIVFGSNAFFGLAFFEFFKDGFFFNYAIATASLLGTFGIVASLFLFELTHKKADFKSIITKLIKNPLIIAIAIGFTLSALGVNNLFFLKSLELLGNAAPGIAVFCLGIFFYDHYSVKLITKSLPLALFRQIALPLGFLFFSYLYQFSSFSFSAQYKEFLLLQTGIPSAVSLAIFADRYNYKIKEITGLIILTSILSFPALGFLYLFSS